MGFHVDMAELIKLRDAYLKDSTAATDSLDLAKGGMNGIITSNSMYGEVGKAINNEINNSHNAIIVGLKDCYTVMGGEFSQAISDFQSSVGESSESAILDEGVMTQTAQKTSKASTKHGSYEKTIKGIYSGISDLISLKSPKSTVERSLSQAKKVLTDAVEKVSNFDSSGTEPQVNQLLTALDNQINLGNQAQGLSYTDPIFTEFAGYTALADGVANINNDIEHQKKLAAQKQEELRKAAEKKQRQEEEEWAKCHPLQAGIKWAQKNIGKWWDDTKKATKTIDIGFVREGLLFVEGFVGAAGNLVGDVAMMASEGAYLNFVETPVVLFGGLTDTILGTHYTPEWAKKDVYGTLKNYKDGLVYTGKLLVDDKTRKAAWDNMSKGLNNMWEDFKKDPSYNLGGLTFDVASMFVGAGEVKAGLTAAKASEGFLAGAKAFGKTVGKAALHNADDFARGLARVGTRGAGLSKDIALSVKNKLTHLGANVSDDLARLSGKVEDAFAYADGAVSKNIGKHNARVYQSNGGNWDEVASGILGSSGAGRKAAAEFSDDASQALAKQGDEVSQALRETGEQSSKRASAEFSGEASVNTNKGRGSNKTPKIQHLDDIPRIEEIQVEFNRNPKHSEEEFSRQLADQQKGMNELTVQEYLDNRERYIAEGRALEGNAAQQAARKEALSKKYKELMESGLNREDAKSQAEEWLDTQAALHNPDQIAGGYPDKIGGMGDTGVNSSIGSQWRYRIDYVDEQIQTMAKTMSPEQLQSTYLNVRLTY